MEQGDLFEARARLGARLKSARTKLNLTLDQVSDLIQHGDKATLSKIESGSSNVPYFYLAPISEVLKIPLGDLIDLRLQVCRQEILRGLNLAARVG